jgi:hypothetical protein
MKKLSALSLPLFIALMCVALFAQAPAGGPPGGGQRGGGGAGGGGGRGGRGAPPPPATGPVADVTNKIVELVNKQDGAGLGKLVAETAIVADEDGHIGIPGSVAVQRLTTQPKKLAISGLRVGELADGGWAVFNYTLDETARGNPNQMKGTSTIVYKKNGADLQVVFMQLSVNGPAIAAH